MFTIANIIQWFSDVMFSHGAHHLLSSVQPNGNGWLASKHYLTIVCKIPAHLHGTFTCSGWVRRP